MLNRCTQRILAEKSWKNQIKISLKNTQVLFGLNPHHILSSTFASVYRVLLLLGGLFRDKPKKYLGDAYEEYE
jgi:hypothetical protein